MISCPNCQAENEAGAKTCHACGKELPLAAPSGELPLWLQALKPDHLKEAEQEEASAVAGESAPAPVAMGGRESTPAVIAAEAGDPAPAMATAATAVPVQASHNGTDTLVATQPTPAVRPVAPVPASGGIDSPAQGAAHSGGSASNETASLISEDDLPGWLRAFSENDASNKAASVDDQSWMLGTTGEEGADTVAENLAQSWQAPARAATARPSAAAVFAAPAESAAKVAKVAKPERVIVAPTPAAAPEPAPAAPAPVAKVPATAGARPGALPARPGANRPVPVQPARSGMSVQRIAVIAFLMALVIFLVVLGIFIVGPALTK